MTALYRLSRDDGLILVEFTAGSVGRVWLTPAQARTLAADLVEAAARMEAKEGAGT